MTPGNISLFKLFAVRTFILFLITGLLLFPGLFTTCLDAQFLQSSYIMPSNPPEPGKTEIAVNSSFFFHNNEFFHPLVKGYTLTGVWVQPELKYSFNETISASAGIHLLKYHGIENLSRKLPVFSFRYSPDPSVILTLGNFPGGENHKLSEVLFNPERHFQAYPEGGISLILNKRFFEGELWIDWERMIFPGDPFREEFTAGLCTQSRLLQDYITLPFQVLAKHMGGQINTGNRRVETMLNILTGLEAQQLYDRKYLNELSFSVHIPVSFHENQTGYGFFPQINAGITGGNFAAGYFRGSGFNSIHGHPLYTSYRFNPVTNIYSEGGTARLITFKAGFVKNLDEHINLIFRFDSWYDLKRSKADYATGIHLIIKFGDTLQRTFKADNIQDL